MGSTSKEGWYSVHRVDGRHVVEGKNVLTGIVPPPT